MTLQEKQAKAEQYAGEQWRFKVDSLGVTMQSMHGKRTIGYLNGQWHCNCPFFLGHETCSHAMALGLIFASLSIVQPAGNEERHE
jgi:hypothetical protein